MASPTSGRRALMWMWCVCGVLLAGSAHAQYFGQNKVRYESPRFEVLKTEHFDIYYSDDEKGLVADAAAMAERWYGRLSRALHHELSKRQPLILYPSHSAFEQTNAVAGDLGEGVGGVTESFKRRIVLPVGASRAETDHVIGHELVHAFQYDFAGSGHAIGAGASGIERLPLWFIEGMAEYYSVGELDPHTAMWIRDAAVHKRLPDYNKLSDPRYFPYRYGQALWCYIADRFGPSAVARTLEAAAGGGDPRAAIRGALGVGPDSLINDWHAAIKAWSEPVAAATDAPSKAGLTLVSDRRGTGHLNLAPALSPDGRHVAFFSERSRFAIEMYLADAQTGKVERQVTKSVVDPHYQSLGFIASSGAFSPDGSRFAFAAVSKGRPLISILDVEHGRTLREQRFPALGEIFSPTWSPDGKRIAFSALANGVSDLWVLDVDSKRLQRLTDDHDADLQPAWSPDGRSIAFVTDRFGDGKDYRLALIDPDSRAIKPLPSFPDAKNIDPAWSADGASLYFVSDRNGISDLYRLELASGERRQLTHLVTGVSGITALSPAFSVARSMDRIVFSAYENSNYNLYRLDGAAALAGGALRDAPTALAGKLPPATASPESAVAVIPPPPVLARFDTTGFQRSRYHPRLSVDNIGQISLGVAGGSSGTGIAGGAVLLWSDMLGDHSLETALQVINAGGSVANNTAALVAYQNMKSRLNWGLQGSQIPTISSDFVEDVVDVNGQPALRDRLYRFWQIDRSVGGGIWYPFDRFRRLELSAGIRHIGFASTVETRLYDQTGLLIDKNTQTLPDSIGSINLGTAGVAFVSDHSVFGGTGPVLGHRSRFEVDPSFGTLRFTEVLADYRQYVPIVRPLVLAGRLLHYGRYGADSDDFRLVSLFLGYPSLVRGYDQGSFQFAEPVFDRLLGTRLAVANVEARLPLLGGLGIIPSSGVPPVELAAFFDAGTAWYSGQKPSFLGGDVSTITSHGAALRVNLFGIAIGEIDLVHPNNRPGKGWYWEFSFQPGF